MKGFNIPTYNYQSTDGARRAYEQAFSRVWPHDDAYLRELAKEVPSSNSCQRQGSSRTQEMLLRMREQDG